LHSGKEEECPGNNILTKSTTIGFLLEKPIHSMINQFISWLDRIFPSIFEYPRWDAVKVSTRHDKVL
jgi:hypothetical protein